jgi:hypothetical protein
MILLGFATECLWVGWQDRKMLAWKWRLVLEMVDPILYNVMFLGRVSRRRFDSVVTCDGFGFGPVQYKPERACIY